MSADLSLSLSFGGIGNNPDPGSASEPSGKSGKGSSMMSMGKSGKGGSMMSMGKSGKGGKGGSMMSMGKSGKGGSGKSGKGGATPQPTCIGDENVKIGGSCNGVVDRCCGLSKGVSS